MRRRALRRPGRCIATSVLAVIPFVGACSPATETTSDGALVRVVERDFHISAPAHVRSGRVTLSVRNDGPDQHELLVVRAGGAPPTLRADGVTVDEERLKPEMLSGLEAGVAGSVRRLPLRLLPGTYVLFCNMSGHYLGGMHTVLEVR